MGGPCWFVRAGAGMWVGLDMGRVCNGCCGRSLIGTVVTRPMMGLG